MNPARRTTHHYEYQAARECFLSLAREQATSVETHVHPLVGPDGDVALDIPRFGNPDATQILVLSSGTHGVEGYCGSYIQCRLLQEGIVERLPNNLGLVIVHGVNPHGFAWRRRVNEDNIDLNRNFIDHGAGHKPNPGYEKLADILVPADWTEEAKTNMWQNIFAEAAKHDEGWQAAAITGGQYAFKDGVFYGGIAPAWSNHRVREIARSLRGKTVVWLDIHTALGPYGAAECIVEYAPQSKPLDKARRLWGERVRNTKTQESVSTDISGSISVGTHEELGDDLVMAGLEYGTVRGKQVLEAVVGDQWLHRYGDLNSELGQELKQAMMDSFYPDDPVWRDTVYNTAIELIEPVFKQSGESGA